MPENVNSTLTSQSTPVGDPIGSTPGVNVAQASNQPLTPPSAATIQNQGSFSAQEVEAIQAHWRQRVSDLQSRADKAEAALNKSLMAQAEMQKQITTLQEQSTQSVSSAAEAAQAAINRANQTEAENAQLKGELRRYQALEAHPHLSAYREFIPTGGTEEDLTKAIEKLNAIREQDLSRMQQGQQPFLNVPGQQGTQQPQTTPPQNPVNPALSPFQALYGNRPNVAPQAGQMPVPIPGSTPAAMNPAGSTTTTQSIDQMLKEAMGDPAKFEEALKRASVLVPRSIEEQMGRV